MLLFTRHLTGSACREARNWHWTYHQWVAYCGFTSIVPEFAVQSIRLQTCHRHKSLTPSNPSRAPAVLPQSIPPTACPPTTSNVKQHPLHNPQSKSCSSDSALSTTVYPPSPTLLLKNAWHIQRSKKFITYPDQRCMPDITKNKNIAHFNFCPCFSFTMPYVFKSQQWHPIKDFFL